VRVRRVPDRCLACLAVRPASPTFRSAPPREYSSSTCRYARRLLRLDNSPSTGAMTWLDWHAPLLRRGRRRLPRRDDVSVAPMKNTGGCASFPLAFHRGRRITRPKAEFQRFAVQQRRLKRSTWISGQYSRANQLNIQTFCHAMEARQVSFLGSVRTTTRLHMLSLIAAISRREFESEGATWSGFCTLLG